MPRALVLALLLAACAPARPDTHDNFDAWLRSLKGRPEFIVVASIGSPPRQIVPLEDGNRVLRWWWSTPEACLMQVTIEQDVMVRYRWEGWGCRATAKLHG